MYIGVVEASAPDETDRRSRRSQAQRTAVTRAALLDATIECLVEQGYANTTTRRIAERAGVSPGALQHHFSGKAELLSAAIQHVWARFAEEILADGPLSAPSQTARTEQLLDRTWELHRGPQFQASMELLIAARTDDELRPVFAAVWRNIARWNAIGTPILFPEAGGAPEFAHVVATGQAAMRGLAMLACIDQAAADALWPATRAHIVELGSRYLDHDKRS
jgi:AcrR family transcriptional regulator